MRAVGKIGVALVVACGATAVQAQETPEDRVRPIRVGNLNVALVGFGYNAHEHPTYDDHFFFDLSYQRRILRREVRAFPLWVRGALQFTEEDRDFSGYTYWPPDSSIIPNPDRIVQEQTSDFGIRAELLVDVLHSQNWALYGGGGFVIHTVSFTSRGEPSGNAAGIEVTENRLAPSAAAGARLFSAKHPYTFFGEVRYGFTYGRAENANDTNTGVPRTTDFDLVSKSSVSFEAGVGVHW